VPAVFEGKRTAWLIDGRTGALLSEFYGPTGSDRGLCRYRGGKFPTGECAWDEYLDKANQSENETMTMKRLLLLTIAALVIATSTAGADTALGCFRRVYDGAHLARPLDQLVTAVKLHIMRPS
jgi:hypothetical protein